MISTALFAAALLTGSPLSLPSRASSAFDTSDATAESVEILRRILADSLDDAFAEDVDEKGAGQRFQFKSQPELHGLVTTLWAGNQTVQHSRGFHLPDVGVFFSFDVALPVVTKEKKDEPKRTTSTKDDEWERMRSQVRGNANSDGGVYVGRFVDLADEVEIDPRAIDTLTETLVRALARHASRIEGLSPSDTITIGLYITGKNHTFFSNLKEDGEDGEPKDEDALGLELQSSTRTLLFATGGGAPTKRVVMRLTLSDLVGQGEGGIARLADRAEINQY